MAARKTCVSILAAFVLRFDEKTSDDVAQTGSCQQPVFFSSRICVCFGTNTCTLPWQATAPLFVGSWDGERKRFLKPFIYQNSHFAKTGLGQT